MRTGLRFRPPVVAPPAELEWVLLRAFGPSNGRVVRVGDPDAALALAAALDLGARIGARTPAPLLAEEVGSAAAAALAERYHGAASAMVALVAISRQVAAVATRLGAPLILLKAVALHLHGCTPIGARSAGDVDILMREDDAVELQRRLVAAGWTESEGAAAPHQLPPLVHPSGMLVELHTKLPAVCVAAGRWADAADLLGGADLIGEDLVQPAPGFAGGALIPSRELVAAHLLAHGIAQHGLKPRTYPFARLLADLADLGVAVSFWRGFFAASRDRWIEDEVSREEILAAVAACRALVAGDLALLETDTDAARVVRHAWLAATDERYCEALRVRTLSPGLVPGRGAATWWRWAMRSLAPPPEDIERRFGAGPLRALLYRLWRPVELIGRLAGYAWRGAVYRLRPHVGRRRKVL